MKNPPNAFSVPLFPILKAFAVSLFVIATSARAEVYHGTIDAKETPTLTTLDLMPGASPGVSVANARNAATGDYILDLPGDVGVAQGVLITSVAKNGKQFTNFLTTSSAHGFSNAPNQFHISAHRAGSFSGKGNSDSSFAFFSHESWLCGTLIKESGRTYSLNSSPGIELHDEFTTSSRTPGVFEIDLSAAPHHAPSQNGILLVNGANDENNFALSQVNTKGSFTIYCHDNSVDGATFKEDPVNFVYLGEDDIGRDGLIALGRISSDGSVQVGAGDFTIRKPGGSTGLWVLEIPGHSPETGTLVISHNGGGIFNPDNIISQEWSSGNQWAIQSRDLPNLGLQDGNPSEAMFSFAFFAKPVIVTTLDDEDDGATALDTPADVSLREAINHGPPLASIQFAAALSGSTVDLTQDQLLIDRSLVIDATSLPEGLTIDANGRSHRLIEVTSNNTVSLHGLTLTGGNPRSGVFVVINLDGGALYCENANVNLSSCTISDNIAENGGGIYCEGNVNLTSCTISGNLSFNNGGGIYSNGGSENATLNLTSCTVSDNSALSGGGISIGSGSSGTTTLRVSACTISGNSASFSGGGIRNSSRTNLSNTILAGNTAPTGPDLTDSSTSTTTLAGVNLMSDPADSSFDGATPAGLIVASPNLFSLGDYGGPTKTRPPRVGSPAIDSAGMTDPGGLDQRGFDRFFASRLDIGAVEAQGSSYLSQIWDSDADGDGRPFGVEFALGSDPLVFDLQNPAHFRVSTPPSSDPLISFGYNPEAVGYALWILQSSTDLENWFPISTMTNPGGATLFSDSEAAGQFYFYRFGAELLPAR